MVPHVEATKGPIVFEKYVVSGSQPLATGGGGVTVIGLSQISMVRIWHSSSEEAPLGIAEKPV